jgi:archaemetzincin
LTPQSEHNIVISPLGNVDKELIGPVIREVERVFGFKTVVTSLLKDVNFALDPAREQYHSTLILAKLENIAPPGTLKLVAITDVDLFIPILTYVFGEAQLGGTSCVVSTHRLAEGISPISLPEALHYRVIKEAVHELGHTFKLRHCPDNTCIMHYSRTVEDVDLKSKQFCRYCNIMFEDEKARLNDLKAE